MTREISTARPSGIANAFAGFVPPAVSQMGPQAAERFVEFFTANIRNANTRRAYAQAVARFLGWCDDRHLPLPELRPAIVAAYVEQLGTVAAAPTVKQHLAAIRMLFDWLVIGQILPSNPASSVRGPKYVVRKGKTPVLQASDARRLLDSIDITTVVGLRDRAIVAIMVYSFARVSAVIGMKVQDYYRLGRRSWLRLHEKGGKFHEVPAHHKAEEYVDAYVAAGAIADQLTGPLFRTARGRTGTLTVRALSRHDALRMIKRHCQALSFPRSICCHTFRATGITAYLDNGGTLEHAQAIAAHESPHTTKLYDRTSDQITLDEIERIAI